MIGYRRLVRTSLAARRAATTLGIVFRQSLAIYRNTPQHRLVERLETAWLCGRFREFLPDWEIEALSRRDLQGGRQVKELAPVVVHRTAEP
jgi:hypothetical protein